MKSSDSNWRPLSVEMVEGVPKRAIQPEMRARATVSAVIWYRDGFRPTCEAVNAGEQISVSSGG